jgi:hypothetical protein
MPRTDIDADTAAAMLVLVEQIEALVAARGPYESEAAVAEAARVETLSLLRAFRLAQIDIVDMGRA